MWIRAEAGGAADLQEFHNAVRNLPSEDWHDLLVVEIALYKAQHHQHSSNHMVSIPADAQMGLSFGCISFTCVACMGRTVSKGILTAK
jgi:hypothetical protein